MNEKSISFIIPIYNSEKTIEECIQSIIENKGNNDIEIILINDGSVDNSEYICKKYQENNKIIKYYYFNNQGVSSARNHGIELATKEWIFFIDSDDKLTKNSIKTLMTMIEKSNSTIIMMGNNKNKKEIEKIDIDSEKMKLITLDSRAFKKEKILNNMFYIWTCWGALYKKDLLIGKNIKFQKELTLGEDILFLLHCYDNCANIEFYENCVYDYNEELTSLSKGFNKRREENTKKLSKLYYDWGEKQNNVIKNAVNKFIIERVLACVSKYYLNEEYKKNDEEKIRGFSNLCKDEVINRTIQEVKLKNFFELRKTTCIYILSIIWLKKQKYKKILNFLKFFKVY